MDGPKASGAWTVPGLDGRTTMRRDTQDEAWESIQEDIPRLERRVLSTIAKVQDGMTCDEVEVITTMTHQTTSATINSLGKKGLLKDSGKRRPTRRGRAAIVWALGDGKPVQKAPTAKSLLRRCAALLRNADPYWALAHEGEEKAWQEEREAVLKAIEGKGVKKAHGLPQAPRWIGSWRDGGGGFGYGEVKKALADAAESYFAEPRERRAELAANPKRIKEILADGAARARKKAAQVLARAKSACGLADK